MSKYYITILIILSAFTHFIYFGRPAELVFDEVYFGNFASAYNTGMYFFDIHPPLGKLLISAAGYIGGFNAVSTDYAAIGNTFTDSAYIWYRILPILAGFLLPIVIFLLCRKLKLSPLASFLAGLFIILENSLLIQSRFIFLDSFLLLFGFLSLYFYLSARQSESRRHFLLNFILSAIFVTLSFSVKWTGLSFFGLIALAETWDLFRNVKSFVVWKKYFFRALLFSLISFIIYFSIFAIHFSLLPKSGPGDAFMTQSFQKTLEGSDQVNNINTKPLGLAGKFLELNEEMYLANKTLTFKHTYSSEWYSWPYMARPIYYWVHKESLEGAPLVESKIYLLGNPFIYWLSSLAVILLIMQMFFKSLYQRSFCWKGYKVPTFIIIGYLANLLPFILIGRVMFLYHYLSALVFAIIIMVYLIDQIKVHRRKIAISVGLLLLFTVSFIFFSPFSYGLPLDTDHQNERFWFSNWI
ncbi:MAG: phospholipid carrier-dependent glycosyltransferase [Candidatus Paceibacterota bacterium]